MAQQPPVRKQQIDITDRASAFDNLTQLHQEYVDIHNDIMSGAFDATGVQAREKLLKDILANIKANGIKILEFPAPVFQPTLQQAPITKARTNPAVISAAETEASNFRIQHLMPAQNFLQTLIDSKRELPEVVAMVQSQVNDFKEEQARLDNIVTIQKSPMKYLTLLAQSKLTPSNWITIGTSKFYMKDDLSYKSVDIPRFKDAFFKDLELTVDDQRLKYELAKSIFTKVFRTPEGVPLPICSIDEVNLLKEGLTNYLEGLRDNLLQLQSEKGPDAFATRTALAKAEKIKQLIDELWAKQQEICKKGVVQPEPEGDEADITANELQNILRKVVVVLLAKQKQVPGYERHAAVADQLLKILHPDNLPNIKDTNLQAIEQQNDFKDILKNNNLLKLLYMLGKGGYQKVMDYIKQSLTLDLLKKLKAKIDAANFLSQEQKDTLVENIDFNNRIDAPKNIEELQTRLLNAYNDEVQNWNLLSADCNQKEQELQNLRGVQQQVAALQAQVQNLLQQQQQANPQNPAVANLQAQVNQLQQENQTLENTLLQTEAENIRLNNELQTKLLEIQNFQAQVKQLDADRLALTNQVQQLTQDLNQARQDLTQAQQDLGQARQQQQQTQQDLVQAQQDLQQKDAQLKLTMNQLQDANREVGRLQNLILQKDNEIAQHAQQMALKQQEVDDCNRRLGQANPNLAAQIQALTQERDSLQQRLTASEQLSKTREQEIKRLQNEYQTLFQNHSNLEAQLKQLQQQQQSTQAKDQEINNLRQQLQTVTQQKDTAEANLKAALAERDRVVKEIAELRNAAQALQAETRRLQALVDTLEPEKGAIARQLLDARNAITALEQRIKACEEEKARLQALTLDARNAITNLQQRLRDCEAQQKQLQDRVQRAASITTQAQRPEDINPAAEEPQAGPLRDILERVKALLVKPPGQQPSILPGPIQQPIPAPGPPGPPVQPLPRPPQPAPGEPAGDYTYRGVKFFCNDYIGLNKSQILTNDKFMTLTARFSPTERNNVAEELIRKCKLKQVPPPVLPGDKHYIPPSRQQYFGPQTKEGQRGGSRKAKKQSRTKTRKNKQA